MYVSLVYVMFFHVICCVVQCLTKMNIVVAVWSFVCFCNDRDQHRHHHSVVDADATLSLLYCTCTKDCAHYYDKEKCKQVRKQACKTHSPPYGLKQRRRPQFLMPMPCTEAVVPPEPFIPEVMPPPPWLPANQCSPKGEKTCPDSRPTRVQNFTPIAFAAAEKSVTVHRNKMTNKKKQNYTQ